MTPLELEQKKAREEFDKWLARGLSESGGLDIRVFLDSIVASAFKAGERAEMERRAQEMLRMTEVKAGWDTGTGANTPTP